MSEAAAVRTAVDVLQSHRTDLDAARAAFSWPDLDAFNWARDLFDPYAAGNDQRALQIVAGDGPVATRTYDEMRRRSNQAASFLREQGVSRGDRVLIMLPNVAPLWEIMLAGIKLGAVLVPATVLLSEQDLAQRLDRGEISHVVAVDTEVETVEAAIGRRDENRRDESGPIRTRIVVRDRWVDGGDGARSDSAPEGWTPYEPGVEAADEEFHPDVPTQADDPLLLYFTSGTTSQPKLVLHSHQSYPVGHLSTMYWLGLQEGDVHCNISSSGWAKHAWSSFFAPWIAGATAFVYRYDRFDAAEALDVIAGGGVTTLCAPPTVWRLLIQEDLAAAETALREVVSAGEPLNPAVIEAIEDAWGITPRDGYGQTETTAQIANAPGQPVKPGSMGRPLPGYDVVLLDPEGNEVDDEGEIALRLTPEPPMGLMQGYQGDRARTEEALGGAYYRTGDIASRDEEGYYTYIGRADDVFKSADYRISPFELESVIIKHDAVAEAAVVPSPHPTRLNVPKAVVTLRAGVEPGRDVAVDLFRFVREHLSPFKRIRRIEFAELPKTVSGKIRRVELREGEETAGGSRTARSANEYWEEDVEAELEEGE